VWLDVQQQPQWRLEVRDDGEGFDDEQPALAEMHVGIRIMGERAERLGARLEVLSKPGHGTSVVLTLPPSPRVTDADAPQRALAA
jgi:two-component system nitrate/nitrite sensor histidine kinase NarX